MLGLHISLAILSVAGAVAGAQLRFRGTTLTGLDVPGTGVEFYGNLPYAEPPVGDLRFRPAVLKKDLTGRTFNATQFGKSCLQPVRPLELLDCRR